MADAEYHNLREQLEGLLTEGRQFGHRAFPRLRLRGIDTAELYTQAGRQALQFVEGILASMDFLLVATRRTGSYGRYLADVKYLVGATDPKRVMAKGIYLNRQLLHEGLARRYLG